VAVLRFDNAVFFQFGAPNDEALHGHPLYEFGLRSYGFYLVENSILIAQLEQRNRVHPRHDANRYQNYRHWIVTFHGETLEVVGTTARVIGESEMPPSQAVLLFHAIG